MRPPNHSTTRRRLDVNRRGSTIVEFALVFVALLFLVCGVFEIGRAMWTYHSLASGIKKATRFAIVHGERCADASAGCQVTIADLADIIRIETLGLELSQMNVTFASKTQSVPCNPLSSCQANSSTWPPEPDNAVGLPVTLNARYTFESVVFSFWPGLPRAAFDLPAKSTEVIQF